MAAGDVPVFEAAVLGGGVNGLSTLYHLQRLGCTRVALFEQFKLRHRLGSSHGNSRITRSTYADPLYVQLMTLVHEEEWPRLERDAQQRLVHPCPGVFFGPPGERFASYCHAVAEAGANVELLDRSEARRRFPLFRFDDSPSVLHDHTAGVVDAAGTVAALQKTSLARGAFMFEEVQVLEIDLDSGPIQIRTAGATYYTQRLVVTAGSWTSRLLPGLSGHLAPARQTVGYFELDANPDDYALGRFPVWIYLGEGENNVYYGLPPFGSPGVKLAQHVTEGRRDEPFDEAAIPPASQVLPLRDFLSRHLSCPVGECVGAEHCIYTNTPREDFVLARLPVESPVAVGAGFSGHGFKFAPWTGRVLAELLLDRAPSDRATEKALERMRLPTLSD